MKHKPEKASCQVYMFFWHSYHSDIIPHVYKRVDSVFSPAGGVLASVRLHTVCIEDHAHVYIKSIQV